MYSISVGLTFMLPSQIIFNDCNMARLQLVIFPVPCQNPNYPVIIYYSARHGGTIENFSEYNVLLIIYPLGSLFWMLHTHN